MEINHSLFLFKLTRGLSKTMKMITKNGFQERLGNYTNDNEFPE